MSVAFHFVEQGSEQWHADREANGGMYTGSNADKLLGSHGVYEYAKAVRSGFGGNFWTKRGHVLEDEAIELYESITGTKILRDEHGVKVGYITNSKYPRCLYSPDGVSPVPIVEVKCFDVKQHLQLINAKSEHDLPLKLRAQVHFGLTISERPFAHLVPYCPKRDPDTNEPLLPVDQQFRIITIRANRAIQANFRRIFKEAEQRAMA